MISVDVTGPRSEVVDTEYARVYAAPPRKLGPIFLLELWGLLLRTSGVDEISVPGLSFSSREHSILVAGWTQMVFRDPVSLEFAVGLYDEQGALLRCDDCGDEICLERSVSRRMDHDTYTYDLGGHLLWPKGDAQVSIEAAGSVTIEFSAEDCMTAREFERTKEGIIFPW